MRNINKLRVNYISLAALAYFVFCGQISSAEILFGSSYHQYLHKYLSESKTSITIAIYFIIIGPDDQANPVNELLNDLIAAKQRKVAIKVILEDSKLKENRLAYEKLKENNIAVYFDTPEHLLHTKAAVIDDRYVFVGSANWSKAAIEDNYEATYFKDSPEDAIALKEQINDIPLQDKDLFLPSAEGVAVSSSFLLSPKLGRRLIKAQADRQFDIYLLLHKLRQERDQSSFDLDYDSIAKDMKYQAPKKPGTYRNEHHYFYERVHRLLKRLRRCGLIDYRKGKVTLKSDTAALSAPITIPFEYWHQGYSDKLSMRAKYMYLVCLYEASRSTKYPFWFRSQEDMSKLYGISDTTISLGLLELESNGLIEITRDKPTPPDYSDRKANVYRMLPLIRK
ncbi:MAG: phospholipase D-like domain-containing protein [Candidatus Omnitrophica bacterium]|nr:phospholipase D-like domain-containing protein [Candidatus Omnitrophota bacterium]